MADDTVPGKKRKRKINLVTLTAEVMNLFMAYQVLLIVIDDHLQGRKTVIPTDMLNEALEVTQAFVNLIRPR